MSAKLNRVARKHASNFQSTYQAERNNDVRNWWIIAVVVSSTIFFFMKIIGATG